MQTKKPIAQAVWELAEPIAASLGYALWDVEYGKEGADFILRLTIDSPAGITVDDCEKMNNAINPVLDEADPIEGSYLLEVSSPGVERLLRRPSHFAAMRGKPVRIRCYAAIDGQRQFEGTLGEYGEDGLTIETAAGARIIPKKNISRVETVYDWENE